MVAERVQRRLAAILAADIVGYSRLMEADEANTLAQLKALREELFDPLVVVGASSKLQVTDFSSSSRAP